MTGFYEKGYSSFDITADEAMYRALTITRGALGRHLQLAGMAVSDDCVFAGRFAAEQLGLTNHDLLTATPELIAGWVSQLRPAA